VSARVQEDAWGKFDIPLEDTGAAAQEYCSAGARLSNTAVRCSGKLTVPVVALRYAAAGFVSDWRLLRLRGCLGCGAFGSL